MNHWITSATALIASAMFSLAAPLDFHFPDDISWKALFDRGFRPKHISGLGRMKVQCIDQHFALRYRRHPAFHLDNGLLMIELDKDRDIRVIEHVSRVPITMEEAERRLFSFHEMFADCLTRRGSIPPLIDPVRGGVMDIGDFSAVALKDGYTLHYYFRSAMNPRTPLLPILMIAVKPQMNVPLMASGIDLIGPPPGYEWYSMDPRVDTPAPGVPPVIKPAVVPPGLVPGSPQRRPDPREAEAGRQGKRLILSLTAAVVCFLLLPLLCLLWMIRKKAAAGSG